MCQFMSIVDNIFSWIKKLDTSYLDIGADNPRILSDTYLPYRRDARSASHLVKFILFRIDAWLVIESDVSYSQHQFCVVSLRALTMAGNGSLFNMI